MSEETPVVVPEPSEAPDPVAVPVPDPAPPVPEPSDPAFPTFGLSPTSLLGGDVADPTPAVPSEPPTGTTSPGTASDLVAATTESDDELVARTNASRDAEPAPAPAGAVNATGDVMRPRTDDDVLTGAFATVVAGPNAGRYVVVQQTLTRGPDGYPLTVQVKTRDDRDEPLVVDYADLRPAAPGGR